MNTYTAYSIGSFIAWAVLWAILEATAKKSTLDYIPAIFVGWCLGWLSATIARALYPAPEEAVSDRKPVAVPMAAAALVSGPGYRRLSGPELA